LGGAAKSYDAATQLPPAGVRCQRSKTDIPYCMSHNANDEPK
jgi:hypothetical protein